MPNPLNVIILHSDEMRGDAVGFNGGEAHTPELDAFARDAAVCGHHFTPNGKCVPSRVAMMTGRYCHTDGQRTVMEPDLIPPHRPDLMKTLRARGYETAVFGHNHCWADFWGGNTPGAGAVDWHSFTHGAYADLLQRRWPVPPAGSLPVPADPDHSYDYKGRLTGELSGFCDDNRTEQAIHFLRHRDRTRPCFLQLNIGAPHPVYKVEEPYFALHDRAALRPFPTALPKNASLPFTAQRRHRTGVDADPAMLAEVRATYLGMIAKVDGQLGRVLDCIAREGLFEDSIVVFTADHGDFAGQYGLCEKFDTVMSDCLLRVPFAIRAPGLPRGVRCPTLTEHTDLPPTVLELLGLTPHPTWRIHGTSMVGPLHGRGGRDTVFASGGHEREMRARFNRDGWDTKPDGRREKATGGKQLTYQKEPDSMARAAMVRTATHKLVVRETGGDELYDLVADPWEMDNRFGDPALAAVQGDLLLRLAKHRLATDTDMPFHPEVGA